MPKIKKKTKSSNVLKFSFTETLMQYLCTGITCACESNVIIYCCITCMCIHVITVTSLTLNSTPGPSQPHTMHIGRENMGISRMRTDREKSHHTVNKVPLTKFSKTRLRVAAIKILKVIYVDDGQYSL